MSKYRNRKVTFNDITFDSMKEGARYLDLLNLERAGRIRDLELQPCFELQPSFKCGNKTERAIQYKADFRYFDVEHGKTIVEDCKGFRTKEYAIKRKLLLYKFPGITFLET